MATKNTISQNLLWALLAVVLLGVGTYSLFSWLKEQEVREPTKVLADYGQVPPFTLTNQDGRIVKRTEFDGHIWLADLIFTRCSGTCPMITQSMLAIERSLARTPNVKLVSFTADPTHDSPEVLLKYGTSYGADFGQWSFLTGPVPVIYDIAKNGFHLPIDSVGGDQNVPIVHSERIVLVDETGHIRGYYDGTTREVQQQVLTDIGDLMRSKKK